MNAIVFGAGKGLEILASSGKNFFKTYNIIAVVDNDKRKDGMTVRIDDSYIKIISPNKIQLEDVDYIIISTLRLDYQDEITQQLLQLNIPLDRILTIHDKRISSYPKIIEAPIDPMHRRLFFDVTYITDHNALSGVPRVCNNLYQQIVTLTDEIVPVRYVLNKFITSKKYDCFITGKTFDNCEYEISPNEKDKILLPDYLGFVDTASVVKWLCNTGVISYGLIHDIIHIAMREDYRDIASATEQYINNFLMYLDNIICGTKTTADVLIDYYKEHNFTRTKQLPVYCFHFGFNMELQKESVRGSIKQWYKNAPTFVMVGELRNPRKNHLLTLKAFQKYYKVCPDVPVQLLICARGGLIDGPEKDLYESDPNLKTNILWVGDASDSELQWVYKNSIGLVYPSCMEGFGLPLVEAASFGCPILCSDIPVFRETAGDNAVYFKVNSVEALCSSIIDWMKSDNHPDSRLIQQFTWLDSAREIIDILNGKTEPYKVI